MRILELEPDEESGVGTGIGFATARVLLLRVVDAWGALKGRFVDDDDDDDVIVGGSASVRRLQQKLCSAAACSAVAAAELPLPPRGDVINYPGGVHL